MYVNLGIETRYVPFSLNQAKAIKSAFVQLFVVTQYGAPV